MSSESTGRHTLRWAVVKGIDLICVVTYGTFAYLGFDGDPRLCVAVKVLVVVAAVVTVGRTIGLQVERSRRLSSSEGGPE